MSNDTTTYTIHPEQRAEMLRQIGTMNVLAISGGRVDPIADGVRLPVSHGYIVEVVLTPADTYTVRRLHKRNGVSRVMGERTDVYCDEVGEVAYRAGMFHSYDHEGF